MARKLKLDRRGWDSRDTSGPIKCVGVSKRYGATQSLKDVDITFAAGEIHGLVGENGAGKSTLIGVISGRVVPDHGTVQVGEEWLSLGQPAAARRLGVVTVYQELSLVSGLTAAQNLFLGAEQRELGILREAEMSRRFEAISEELGIGGLIGPRQRVGPLPLALQQMIEIMRAVLLNARAVMLDEPSASLGRREREILHGVIRRLKEAGRTVIVVSHDLEEVLGLSDDITVMRDGKITGRGSKWDRDALVMAMTGRDLRATRRPEIPTTSRKALEVRDLRLGERVRGVDFALGEGEVVGLWGLVGAGRTSLLRALGGLEPQVSGHINLGGGWEALPRHPSDAIGRGIALLPEDRRSALFGQMSVLDNVFVRQRRDGWKAVKEERAAGVNLARAFGLSEGRLTSPASTLSGGNQQKVLLMRAASWEPKVLLLDEPTRGIDVGAKREVFDVVGRLAKEGMGCLLCSSDLEDIVQICTRLLIMARGKIVEELAGESLERAEEHEILLQGFEGSAGESADE